MVWRLTRFFGLPQWVDNGIRFNRGSIVGRSALLLITTISTIADQRISIASVWKVVLLASVNRDAKTASSNGSEYTLLSAVSRNSYFGEWCGPKIKNSWVMAA